MIRVEVSDCEGRDFIRCMQTVRVTSSYSDGISSYVQQSFPHEAFTHNGPWIWAQAQVNVMDARRQWIEDGIRELMDT